MMARSSSLWPIRGPGAVPCSIGSTEEIPPGPGGGGAGLGLSIVTAIVEAHGGRVAATAPDGAGATFEVRLPARRAQELGH
jgi:signal transduction histidine kinase